jgi:hypothetical protein
VQISQMTARCQSVLHVTLPPRSVVVVASISMLGFLLSPAAVLAGALGAWRLGADQDWASRFLIADGLLSRYQLWFAVAIGMQTSASIINRWVANQGTAVPVLSPRRDSPEAA